MIYASVNRTVLDLVPAHARSILDVGCGNGVFGAAVKSRTGGRVTGITFGNDEAQVACFHLDRVVVADLNDFDPRSLGRFDCIVCSHVLEHLLAPEMLLLRLRDCLEESGVLIVALPNVLFWRQRFQFLLGRFRYADGGLMDRTHFRFFDWHTSAQLILEAGFTFEGRIADGAVPLSSWLGRRLAQHVNAAACRLAPGLFGFQFVFRGTANPEKSQAGG